MTIPVPSRSVRAVAPRRRTAVLGVGAAGLAVLLTACAGSSSGTAAESSGGDAAVAPQPAAASAVPGTASVTAADSSSGGKADYVVAPQAVVTDRSVVVRADVGVRVTDVLTATTALGALGTKHDATVASQSVSAGGPTLPQDVPTDAEGKPVCPSTGCPTTYASSTTTLRLDNDEVDALLADVARLGTVETAVRTSEDVTADVADVASRVRNAEASVARVRALMSQATRIGDIVALEGELSRRQADLEALQARQRALADQTAQATVTVRLYAESAPVTTTETESGFLPGLRAGWDAFTGFIAGALTVIGALVPWLLVLVPLALVVWLVVRRRREGRDLVDHSPETA